MNKIKKHKRLEEEIKRRKHKLSTESSDSSSSSSEEELHKTKRTKRSKRGKRDSSSSSSSSTSSTSSSSSSSSSSSEDDKEKRKMDKKRVKKLRNNVKKHRKEKNEGKGKDENKVEEEASADIPLSLMENDKSMAPMTKEEWEKKQNIVKRVCDEVTGRSRLIKGDGEVIEEIVSRDRHKAINKQATKGDGEFFQAKLAESLTK